MIFKKRKRRLTLAAKVRLGRKWKGREQKVQERWAYDKTLLGGWGLEQAWSERSKILPLGDSVRTTREGVKVAPWSCSDGGPKMKRMSFVLSALV